MTVATPTETMRRLERASKHLTLLKDLLAEYAQPRPRRPGERTSRPYRLTRRWNDTTECNDLVLTIGSALPDEVILLTSETAHHLKSALDALLYSLATEHSGPLRTQVAFPLLDDEPHWEEDTERFERGIDPLPEAAKVVVRRLQPFRLLERGEIERHHGENLLRLSYLLNVDRQRTPPLAFLPVPSTTAPKTGKGAKSFLTDGLPIPTLKHNTVIRRCIPDQYDLSVQVAFNVVFGDEWPANLRRRPITDVLTSLAETVAGYVLPEFAAAAASDE